jgi:2'-deoxynucleoside 5'-phosphate N-hydrolase
MLRSAFISVGYKNRSTLSSEINTIVDVLNEYGFNTLVFVREFVFLPGQEKEMMQKALVEIKKSHIVIAEASTKPIGVGIEVGYAKALSKPIIYLRKCNSEKSTTLSGISNHSIVYSDTNHLKNSLQKAVKDIKSIIQRGGADI